MYNTFMQTPTCSIKSASIVKTGTRVQPVCRPRSSGQLWYQVQSNIIMRSRQTAAMAGYVNVLPETKK